MSASNANITQIDIAAAKVGSLSIGSVVIGGGAGVSIGKAALGVSTKIQPRAEGKVTLEMDKLSGKLSVKGTLIREKWVPNLDNPWETMDNTDLLLQTSDFDGAPPLSVSLPIPPASPLLQIDATIEKTNTTLPSTMTVNTSKISLSDSLTLSTHQLKNMQLRGLPPQLAGLTFFSLNASNLSASQASLDQWAISSASRDGSGSPFHIRIGKVEVLGIPPLHSDQSGTVSLGDLPLDEIPMGSMNFGPLEVFPGYRLTIQITVSATIQFKGVKVHNVNAELAITKLALENVVVPISVGKINIGEEGSPTDLSSVLISALTAS